MQKIVYLSNSRDYSEQGNINENKYFTQVNNLLEDGWKVIHVTHEVLEFDANKNMAQRESLVAFLLLEKEENKS